MHRRPRRRLRVESLEQRQLLAAGVIDAGFGAGGHMTTDFGGTDLISAPSGIAIQADGKMVAVGQGGAGADFLVARYEADGSLDVSFSGDGKVNTNITGTDRGYAVAIQADGKILVGGRADTHPAIVRYNDDGTLDTSFGAGGVSVLSSLNSNHGDKVLDLAIQSDGMIVGAVNGDSSNQLTVVRLTPSGALDMGFSADGVADINFQLSQTEFAHAVKIQQDGKIVVVGRVTNSPSDGSPDIGMARLTTTGALDVGFGSGGKVQTSLGATEGANDIALQSDGKIVIGAQSLANDAALLRYTTAGVLDTNFGVSGVATPGFGLHSAISSIEVTATDKIVAAMPFRSTDFSIAQFEPDGALDASFGDVGDAGSASHDLGGNDSAFSLKLQTDGKIVVGGISDNDFAVARFTGDAVAPPANDAPEITALSLDQAMIFEDESVTLSVDFTDLDAGDEHTVVIDWGDGTIQVETLNIGDRTFDFQHPYLDDGAAPGNGTAQDDYTISVTVTDDGSSGDTESILLTVKNLDPVAADQVYTIDEDGLLDLNLLTGVDDNGPFAVTDPGSLDTHTAVAGTYPSAAGGSVAIAADGEATYTPAPDFAGSDSFEFTVHDDDAGSDVGSVMIILDPVNDEPSFSMLGDQIVDEDSGSHVVSGFAAALPGGGADEAGQSFSYNVSNDNSALFEAGPAIDASGQLTFTVANNAVGMATLTVSVTDDGGTASGGDDTSPEQTFQITVLSTAQQIDVIQDAIQQLVDDGKLPEQQARRLNRNLIRAERFIDRGFTRPAFAMLRRTQIRVNLLARFNILSETDGDALNDALDAAIRSLLQ